MPAEAQSLRPLPQTPYIDAEKPVITLAGAWVSSETPITRTAELADLFTRALFRRTIPLPRRKQPESPWALRGVNLVVYPAEVVAITGDRLHGESAILRLIASANQPTRGKLNCKGRVSPILNAADNMIVDQLEAFEILLIDECTPNNSFSAGASECLLRCLAMRRTFLIAASGIETLSNLCTREVAFHDGALIHDTKLQAPLRATA